LSGHPNIIQYLSAVYVDKSKSGHACGEYLLVTELCTGELFSASLHIVVNDMELNMLLTDLEAKNEHVMYLDYSREEKSQNILTLFYSSM
jgi:hypothetical protein